MLGLYRVVDDTLEHLNYQKEQHMSSIKQLAVFAIRLTVRYEHPEAFHYATFYDN